MLVTTWLHEAKPKLAGGTATVGRVTDFHPVLILLIGGLHGNSKPFGVQRHLVSFG